MSMNSHGRSLITFISQGAALALTLFSGCGVSNNPHVTPPSPPPPPPPATAPVPAPTEAAAASTIIYPDGWDMVVISADYANEKAYGNAHWWIDRTDCGDEQYGPFETATWNAFANALNAAVKAAPALTQATETCSYEPEGNEMDGSASAELLDGSMRLLFEVKNGQMCTTVPDARIAAEALRWINDVVVLTNQAGCPKRPTPVPPPVPGG